MDNLTQNTKKKPYNKPVIEQIQIDTQISLVMTTGSTTPPDTGGDPGGGGIWG